MLKRITNLNGDVNETHFHYDDNNQLIAETNGEGLAQREYLYLAGSRMAMVDYLSNKSSDEKGELLYVHNDHLGTPTLITDGAREVVWSDTSLPFGEVATGSQSEVENPLRFPGQYADNETGYSYNYFRDYDPSLGRYIQSDPIGLAGGVNTFAYVYGNPIGFIDPLGLLPPSNTPTGFDFSASIVAAEKMTIYQFYSAVKTNGIWDFKNIWGAQYEDFGNYHFGVVGRALGISEGTLRRGAGAYQVYSGTSDSSFGSPFDIGNSNFGDDPNDQKWIKEGIDDVDDANFRSGSSSCGVNGSRSNSMP